jgi:ABC-type lipoprotein export system ATPase subunit
LINNPEILLADEPTGALDTHTTTEIIKLIKSLKDE